MMNRKQPLFKWLALAALLEWFLLRTVTRAAIHVPKSPAMIAGYGFVNQIGLVAATFVGLLTPILLLWIAWHEWRTTRALLLPLSLLGLTILTLIFLVYAPPAWLALSYQLLAITAIVAIVLGGTSKGTAERGLRLRGAGAVVLLLPALSLCAGLFYQLLPNLYAMLSWPGPPPLSGVVFNTGELLVIGSVVAWWWAYGLRRSLWSWIVAALPAILFALSFLRDPAMTGILTIWSTGLTLYLPWPSYVVTLWFAGVAVLAAWRSQRQVAYAIILFVAAGYAPQLSTQLFCAIIALWLLKSARPLTRVEVAFDRQVAEAVLSIAE